MSTTLIDGGPAGADEAGGQYRNRILTDRIAWWRSIGRRQGVLRGFVHSTVAGQMQLSFTAGETAVEERDSLGVANTARGYLVWTGADAIAQFDVASASARNDAVVVAFVDVSVGAAALGSGTTTVGGQLVVVPGVSGSSTPRTDAEIQSYVGSGGWVRLMDVAIAATDTEINPASVTKNVSAYLTDWRTLPLSSGFTGTTQVRRNGDSVYFRGNATGTYATSTAIQIVPVGGVPTSMRPAQRVNVFLAGNSTVGSSRAYVEPDGSVWVVTGPNAPTYISLDGFSATYLVD